MGSFFFHIFSSSEDQVSFSLIFFCFYSSKNCLSTSDDTQLFSSVITDRHSFTVCSHHDYGWAVRLHSIQPDFLSNENPGDKKQASVQPHKQPCMMTTPRAFPEETLPGDNTFLWHAAHPLVQDSDPSFTHICQCVMIPASLIFFICPAAEQTDRSWEIDTYFGQILFSLVSLYKYWLCIYVNPFCVLKLSSVWFFFIFVFFGQDKKERKTF